VLKTKPCLLVVDDHFAPATFTRQKLIQKGYEVLTAQNRQDALELSRTEYPDLILNDVDMTRKHGPGECPQTSIFILLTYFFSQTGVN